MVTLDDFKANAKTHGICDMVSQWDNAKSKKQLMDIALSIRGIQYIAEAIARGWGISPDVISKEFSAFLNGKYIRNQNGYTSCVYCSPPDKEIIIDTTAALIIDFNGIIKVDRHISELHVVKSCAKVICRDSCDIYSYCSDVTSDDNHVLIKKVQ